MTTTGTDNCRHCDQPTELARATWHVDRGTFRDPDGYRTERFHTGGDQHCADGHTLAAVHPRCLKCRSTNYVFSQDAWADWWRCGDCGHADRVPLGD